MARFFICFDLEHRPADAFMHQYRFLLWIFGPKYLYFGTWWSGFGILPARWLDFFFVLIWSTGQLTRLCINTVSYFEFSRLNIFIFGMNRGYFLPKVSRCGTVEMEAFFYLRFAASALRPSIERPVNKASGVALVTTFHPRILAHQPPLCIAGLSTIEAQHLHWITGPFSLAFSELMSCISLDFFTTTTTFGFYLLLYLQGVPVLRHILGHSVSQKFRYRGLILAKIENFWSTN